VDKPWSVNISQYEESELQDETVKQMAVLTRFIGDSHLANGLFAWTSMWDLCITQTPVTYPYDGPYLKVSPMFNGFIEFRFIDTPATGKQWFRRAASNEAIPCFLKFLDQLRWFPTESLQMTSNYAIKATAE
jgi:hypothetical protein